MQKLALGVWHKISPGFSFSTDFIYTSPVHLRGKQKAKPALNVSTGCKIEYAKDETFELGMYTNLAHETEKPSSVDRYGLTSVVSLGLEEGTFFFGLQVEHGIGTETGPSVEGNTTFLESEQINVSTSFGILSKL